MTIQPSGWVGLPPLLLPPAQVERPHQGHEQEQKGGDFHRKPVFLEEKPAEIQGRSHGQGQGRAGRRVPTR